MCGNICYVRQPGSSILCRQLAYGSRLRTVGELASELLLQYVGIQF